VKSSTNATIARLSALSESWRGDPWNEFSGRAIAVVLENPDRLAEVPEEVLAPGPAQVLHREIRERLALGRSADQYALLTDGTDTVRAHVLWAMGSDFSAIGLARDVSTCRQYARRAALEKLLDQEPGPISDEGLSGVLARLDKINSSVETTQDEGSSWAPQDLVAVATGRPAVEPTMLRAEGGGALFYPGKRHTLTGEFESLKSFVMLATVVEAIKDGHNAAFVDFDDMGPDATLERLVALGLTEEEICSGLLYFAPASCFDAAAASRLESLIAERKPVVACLDGLNPALELQGLNPDRTVEVQRWQREVLGPWHRAGVATVIGDHVSKNREQRGRYSIGSERKVTGVDVHLGLELISSPLTREGGAATVKITAHKDRPAGHRRGPGRVIGSITFTAEPGGRRVDWSLRLGVEGADGLVAFRPTHLMERVSHWLEAQPEPVSQRRIEGEVQGNAKHLRTALGVLVDEGFVAREGQGRALHHRSLRPYREADDPSSDTFVGAVDEGIA
jgi:hypothetical protein